jgi:hypothetical protein
VEWYQAAQDGTDMRALTLAQITRYAAMASVTQSDLVNEA